MATLTLRNVPDDLVARLVAAREIGLTPDRDVARDLAERYQLVTDETNLLLVIERAEGRTLIDVAGRDVLLIEVQAPLLQAPQLYTLLPGPYLLAR